MTGEEYFERISALMKKYGKPKFDQNEGFHGVIPVLSELVKYEDGIVAGEIAEKFQISTARVAKILNYLEDKEYVIRKKHEIDKRVTIVSITEKGKEFFFSFKKQRADDMTYALEGIPDSDMETFIDVTEKIISRLCQRKVEENA